MIAWEQAVRTSLLFFNTSFYFFLFHFILYLIIIIIVLDAFSLLLCDPRSLLGNPRRSQPQRRRRDAAEPSTWSPSSSVPGADASIAWPERLFGRDWTALVDLIIAALFAGHRPTAPGWRVYSCLCCSDGLFLADSASAGVGSSNESSSFSLSLIWSFHSVSHHLTLSLSLSLFLPLCLSAGPSSLSLFLIVTLSSDPSSIYSLTLQSLSLCLSADPLFLSISLSHCHALIWPSLSWPFISACMSLSCPVLTVSLLTLFLWPFLSVSHLLTLPLCLSISSDWSFLSFSMSLI